MDDVHNTLGSNLTLCLSRVTPTTESELREKSLSANGYVVGVVGRSGGINSGIKDS